MWLHWICANICGSACGGRDTVSDLKLLHQEPQGSLHRFVGYRFLDAQGRGGDGDGVAWAATCHGIKDSGRDERPSRYGHHNETKKQTKIGGGELH